MLCNKSKNSSQFAEDTKLAHRCYCGLRVLNQVVLLTCECDDCVGCGIPQIREGHDEVSQETEEIQTVRVLWWKG